MAVSVGCRRATLAKTRREEEAVPAIRDLFATRLYQASLAAGRGFEAFNAELAAACGMLAAEDRAGRAWCHQNGYGGYTSYGSLDDLSPPATGVRGLQRPLEP